MAGKYAQEFNPVRKGSVYSATGKCPVCGATFKHFEPNGVFCPNHPKVRPEKYNVRFGSICRRFEDYSRAYTYLCTLRGKAGQEDFDERDFQIKEKPLSFTNLSEQWLEIKKETVRHGSYIPIRSHIRPAQDCFGEDNIKNIGYADIERFIIKQKHWSDKTKFNCLATLKEFWDWCHKAHDIPKLKNWPHLKKPQMGYRKIIDIETQEEILDKVREQIESSKGNLRIWLGIKLLATYPSIRPVELWSLNEKHIDRKNGFILIPESISKDGSLKTIPLDNDDLDQINQFTLGLPDMPFFRHDHHVKKSLVGRRVSRRAFYTAWKKACNALGIEDVDLYGGTKHSTITAMRQVLTFEETKEAAMISTNKALERYMHLKGERLKEMYATRKKLLDRNKRKSKKVVSLRDE